jgi:hypothetical protein
MKRSDKTLGRRRFLKTGIFGGVIVAVYPRGKLLNSPLLHSHPHIKPKIPRSEESSARLLQIACTYGSEFGEIKEIKNGCF